MNVDSILEEMRGKDPSSLGDSIPDEVRGKTPDELVQLVQIMDAHLRSLHQEETGEFRDQTPAEQQAFKYGLKVREAAMKRIEEHRALADVFARKPEAVKRVYANIRNGVDASNGVVRMGVAEARDMALRTLDDRSSGAHLDSNEKDQLEKTIRRNTDVARRILVTENDAYRSAWLKVVTLPQAGYYLDDEERNAMRAYDEYRVASLTAAAGGVGVPVKLAA